MPRNQKMLQKNWYDGENNAINSRELIDLGNETHLRRFLGVLPREIRGLRTLEVGCGEGWYASRLHPLVLTDISVESLKRAPTVAKAAADAENLPFADGSFDAVFGFGILHHVEDVEKCLVEIRRVLKPGGVVAFGGENSALCPANYLFPFIYGNWVVEKGFLRMSKGGMGALFRRLGYADFRCDYGGFAVYGLSRRVYEATKRMEALLERIPGLRRFAGYMYISARKG